jgi:oxygen-independent coproporphyrinogen-3 oxidase
MKLGAYIQVPFCQTKCTYCNFHTGVVAREKYGPYVAAVEREIREHRALYLEAGIALPEAFADTVVDTVYLGGGTPSLLDPKDLAKLLDGVRESFSCELSEVTLEADPETVDEEKARGWFQAGINRISFGLQSFSDRELSAVGRLHRREDIERALPLLRGAGINNISFDLIAGLPHQTAESWGATVGEALALGPEHISIYMLEVDEGSRLGREILKQGPRYGAGSVPGDDDVANFYDFARGALGAGGYHHYEISNWAIPGKESIHNLKYWRREAYLGFGAGAHSFSGTQRWANAHDAAKYAETVAAGRIPCEGLEELSAGQALDEELFLGLRQLDGIDIEKIERDYGVQLSARLESLERNGFVARAGAVVRLAPERLSISNEVFVDLLR